MERVLLKRASRDQTAQNVQSDLNRYCPYWSIDLIAFNAALRQQFSHTTATAHIIHVFPVFYLYQAGALKRLFHGHSNENRKDGTQDPWITSQNTTIEPRRIPSFILTAVRQKGALCIPVIHRAIPSKL